MQTFLTDTNFQRTAESLDNKRLGKQRVETMQIMKALLLPEYGWKHHPAVKMWKGYELALLRYQEAICREWAARGFKDTCLEKTTILYFEHRDGEKMKNPKWLTDELCETHRSNLIRKDSAYLERWPNTPLDLPYLWPI